MQNKFIKHSKGENVGFVPLPPDVGVPHVEFALATWYESPESWKRRLASQATRDGRETGDELPKMRS